MTTLGIEEIGNAWGIVDRTYLAYLDSTVSIVK